MTLPCVHKNKRGNKLEGQPRRSRADYNCNSVKLQMVRSKYEFKLKQIPVQDFITHGRLTVVLDVDETLIHSWTSHMKEYPQQQQQEEEENSFGAKTTDQFTIKIRKGELINVNKRPGLDKFLFEASKQYELIAYTAGIEGYAKPLLDWLDPEGTIFRYRLYRDSCLFIRGYYLKDLIRLNRNMSRVVLVDNNAYCFLPQLANGIPISSFYDDTSDTALEILLSFLESIKNLIDVRPFLKKSFNLELLLGDYRAQICE